MGLLRRATVAALAGTLALAAMPPADGWVAEDERPHHADLAVAALSLLPENHRALLAPHEEEIRRGAQDPDQIVNPFFHREDPDDPEWGGAEEKAAETYAEAVRILREGGDVAEAAYQLGMMSHYVLDLAQPMHSGGWDAIANAWHSEYEDVAYDERASLDLRLEAAEKAQPLEGDQAARAAMEASNGRWRELLGALEHSDGAWTPEVKKITEEVLREGVRATAGGMHGALLAAGIPAAAPAPTPIATPWSDMTPAPATPDAEPPRRGEAADETNALPGSEPPPRGGWMVGVVIAAAALLAAYRIMSTRAPQGGRAGGDEEQP